MKPYLAILGLVFSAVLSCAQVQVVWTNIFDSGQFADDQFWDAALDEQGGFYLTGNTYTVKFDKDGQQKWALPIPGLSLTLDNAGHLYVGSGYSTLTKLTVGGQVVWNRTNYSIRLVQVDKAGDLVALIREGFQVAKFTSNGDLIWKTFNPSTGTNPNSGRSMAIGPNNEIFVTGVTVDSSNRLHLHTMKVDAQGRILWVTAFDPSRESAGVVVVDSTGTPFVTGYLDRAARIPLLTYDAAGKEKLLTTFRGPLSTPPVTTEAAGFVRLDGIGNLFISAISSMASGQGSYERGVLLKLSRTGQRLWTAYDETSRARGDIAFDLEGNIYVASTSLKKYDRSGNLLWTYPLKFDDVRVFVDREGFIRLAGTTNVSGFPRLFQPAYFAVKLRQQPLLTPLIVSSPTDQTLLAGASVTLNVGAQSIVALSYQWRFGGEPLSGATNQSYSIKGLDFATSGWYSVEVSNEFGFTRSPDVLVVASTRLENARFAAGDIFQFSFRTETNWTYQIEASTDLVDWASVVRTNSTAGRVNFSDRLSTNSALRVYRVLLQ